MSSSGFHIGGSSCAALSKIYKGTITVDADSSNIAAGAEAEFSVTVTGVADGDIVIITPPNTAASSTAITWSAWSAADTVKLRIANNHASTAFTANSNWHYLVINVATGNCS